MSSSTGYIMPNGVSRKLKASVGAALSIGPALVVLLNYGLALIHPALPDGVVQAADTVIEGLIILITGYLAAPAITDQIAVAPHPAVAVAPVAPAPAPSPVLVVPVATIPVDPVPVTPTQP